MRSKKNRSVCERRQRCYEFAVILCLGVVRLVVTEKCIYLLKWRYFLGSVDSNCDLILRRCGYLT
jgi:hypothetical protein